MGIALEIKFEQIDLDNAYFTINKKNPFLIKMDSS